MRGHKNQSVSFSDPLTLTLSRGERGLLQHPPAGEGTFTTPSRGRGDFYNTLRRERGLLQHPPPGEVAKTFCDTLVEKEVKGAAMILAGYSIPAID